MREYSTPNLPDKKKFIYIKFVPEFNISDYDLSNPKELSKYFKSIERICRNSRTYKKLINFLRENVDMNKCSYFKNVDNIDTYSLKIHIHHTPLTLYDIVTTVYNKRLLNHESLSEMMVAKEVMWLHYNLFVGLIPLSETVHGSVHNGQAFIPTTKVYGMYKTFVKLYEPYMDKELLKVLSNMEEMSEDYDTITKLLEVSPVFIDYEEGIGFEFPKPQELAAVLSHKLKEMDKAEVASQYTIKDKETFLKNLDNK